MVRDGAVDTAAHAPRALESAGPAAAPGRDGRRASGGSTRLLLREAGGRLPVGYL